VSKSNEGWMMIFWTKRKTSLPENESKLFIPRATAYKAGLTLKKKQKMM